MSHGPIPIVVGVTGHTDLRPEDVDTLSRAVTDILSELKAKYGHSDVLVLSPLAEGADRLVAHAALRLGLRLVVAMPLETEDYKKDFVDDASRAEFDALITRAERTFVAPYPSGQTMARPDCYAHIGAYVARHCHLLIALWNGATTNKIGGTAEIIRYRTEGMANESAEFVRLLDATDTGVVYHVVTPRRSDPSVPPGTKTGDRLTIGPPRYHTPTHARAALRAVLKGTDKFNAIGAEHDGAAIARRKKSAGYLLPSYKPADLPPGLQAIRSLYASADAAAIRYQSETRRVLLWLFLIGFFIVVAFEIFAHGDDTPGRAEAVRLTCYLVMLVAGAGVHRWATRHEVDMRYFDYRALAEALRVEFYWRVAEVPSCAADYCMRYRVNEMEWIRKALRAGELLASNVPWTGTADASVAALKAVVEDWVHGQHKWFRNTGHRDHHLLHSVERWTKVLIITSLVAGVVVCVLTYAPLFRRAELVASFREHYDWVQTLAIALVGLLPAAAALLHGYAEQRGLAMHLKRYERIGRVFGAALGVVDARMEVGAWGTTREALAELGREALEENADWVMLHRERPLELPV